MIQISENPPKKSKIHEDPVRSSHEDSMNLSPIKPRALLGGWPTPLKNDGVKINGKDDIPSLWNGKINTNQY